MQNKVSHSSLKILVFEVMFLVPDPYLSLKLPITHHLGLSMYKVLLDSDKYLLSYNAMINPLEPDVHHMTSQILSILIDFYPYFKDLQIKQ